ncbi:MAG: FkbM family methyltransferase [Candidatus Nanoarchaeia archaeon]
MVEKIKNIFYSNNFSRYLIWLAKYLYLKYTGGFYIKQRKNKKWLCKDGSTIAVPIYKHNDKIIYLESLILIMQNFDLVATGKVRISPNFIKIKINGVPLIFRRVDDLLLYFFRHELPGYLLYRDIKEHDVVVDAGAYHGGFCIYAAKKAKKGHIYCFEPDEKNRNILEANIKLNKVKNVTVIGDVLLGKSGFINFYEIGSGVSSIFPTNQYSPDIIQSKSAVSLAHFCIKYKIKKINFLKMDVEGAEYDIVLGSKFFIKDFVDYMAIASYHIIGGQKSYRLLEPLLHEIGFNTVTDYPKHLTTYAWK